MSDQNDHLVRLVRLARGLEMGGFYNAAKLLWAAAYSQEVRSSNALSIPTLPTDLSAEMTGMVAELKAMGIHSDVIAAFERGQKGVEKNATIPATDVPETNVCRSCGEIVLGPVPDTCPNCGAWELTFRTFPAVYYLEPLPPDQALEKLAAVPDTVMGLIRRLSEDQMARQPKPGEWSIHEVLVHIMLAQELLAGRVKKMLAEDNPSLSAMSASELQDVDAISAREVLDVFRTSREKTVADLRAAAPLGWWRTGEHEEFAMVTVLQQASYFARHDHNHLTQIRQILKAIGV